MMCSTARMLRVTSDMAQSQVEFAALLIEGTITRLEELREVLRTDATTGSAEQRLVLMSAAARVGDIIRSLEGP